jgi:hypothetical protein
VPGVVPRRLIAGLTGVLLTIAAVEAVLVAQAVTGGWHGPVGQDFDLYVGFARSWLDGRGWYLPEQMTASYVVEDVNGNVYPPVLLYLMIPFALGLPGFIWWGLPLGLIAAALRRLQPAWWAWPVLAFVFCYPRTWTVLVVGNPSLWAISFAVAGVAWNWPAVGSVLKLTLAPLALIGVTRRSWWIAACFALVAALPFGPLWIDYMTVMGNTTASRGFGYVMGEWPIALALLAVALSGRRQAALLQQATSPNPDIAPSPDIAPTIGRWRSARPVARTQTSPSMD